MPDPGTRPLACGSSHLGTPVLGMNCSMCSLGWAGAEGDVYSPTTIFSLSGPTKNQKRISWRFIPHRHGNTQPSSFISMDLNNKPQVLASCPGFSRPCMADRTKGSCSGASWGENVHSIWALVCVYGGTCDPFFCFFSLV